jgi:hypothetical protein
MAAVLALENVRLKQLPVKKVMLITSLRTSALNAEYALKLADSVQLR